MGLESLGKLLLTLGGVLLGVGLLFLLFGRLGLGKLPGDIVIRGERYVFYFPLVTMIIISAVLTLVLNLLRRL
ncbi:MAG TPA: DUF2905 domain-containing protein [Firmicutes bacterium]|nr:DUF2905 domain-containing protein [Bacillota bacterium]